MPTSTPYSTLSRPVSFNSLVEEPLWAFAIPTATGGVYQVVQVIVISQNTIQNNGLFWANAIGYGSSNGIWVETSYSSAYRGTYAGIGMYYDASADQFTTSAPATSSLLQNSTNGHFYEAIVTQTTWSQNLLTAGNWDQVKLLAEQRAYRGLSGYLATITSADEQTTVALAVQTTNTRSSYIQNLGTNPVDGFDLRGGWYYTGGKESSIATDGMFVWQTGPETGTTIASQSSVNSFTNWLRYPNGTGYPSAANQVLDAVFIDSGYGNTPYLGKWVTSNSGSTSAYTFGEIPKGYVVEYGGMPATYQVSASTSVVNEGSSVVFTIATTNVLWGSTISYNLSGGGITASDIYSGALTGVATVSQATTSDQLSGRATVTVTLASDSVTEGNESLIISVADGSAATMYSSVAVVDSSPGLIVSPAPPFPPICFLKGTNVRSKFGSIFVEALKTTEELASQNQFAKVKWIGYQRRTPEFAQFDDYLPVKICAGALEENVPVRDLYLSPDHAVLVDGHLIHAQALVNGRTIIKMTEWQGDIEYYHIETENHEIIFAEGVPCETFIDNVSREQFDNYAEYQALYPYTQMMRELPLPRVKFRRQMPSAIWRRLMERADLITATQDQA